MTIYSSVDSDKYFIYDLEWRKLYKYHIKHNLYNYLDFEFFVELGCPSIVIGGNTYYRHQVCLFLTFDLSTN